jgi:hypothetical protein
MVSSKASTPNVSSLLNNRTQQLQLVEDMAVELDRFSKRTSSARNSFSHIPNHNSSLVVSERQPQAIKKTSMMMSSLTKMNLQND